MLTDLFPNLFNFKDLNLYDLIQVVATIILAIAAISVGVHASKLNEEAIESNQRTAELMQESLEQSKMMKQAEMNMAVSKQIMEIYNFFIKDIFMNNFFDKENGDLLREKCNEILFQSAFIFNQEVCETIEKSINKILDASTAGIPSYTEEEYALAKNDARAGIEIKIYEALMNRENTAEDMINSYENSIKKTVFLFNIRNDIANAFSYFKFNLGPEPMDMDIMN